MTNFARRASAAADHRQTLRRNPLAGVIAVGILLLTLIAAAPAGAVVTEIAGGPKVGLQPRTQVLTSAFNVSNFANNNGNVVVDGASVYPIYWDPSRTFMADHHEWLTNLNGFFQRLGADSGDLATAFGALTQYRDRANETAAYKTNFKGSYTDSTAFPTSGCIDPNALEEGSEACLTDAQLRAQLQSFIATHGLPTGMHSIFYLITPPGVTVCLEAASEHCSDFTADSAEIKSEIPASTSFAKSFCSYHGAINPDAAAEGDASTILYAAIPWTAAGTIGNGYQWATAHVFEAGLTCQDGGWSPAENAESFEKAPPPTKEEEEILHEEGKHTSGEKAKLEKKRRLEGPHQEEPNQEGKGETGDYSAGLSDLIINQVAEEQADIVTDPLLTSWQNAGGLEVTDECRNTFANTINGGLQGSITADENTEAGTMSNQVIGGGDYYINNLYNLAGGRCAGGVALVPRFTAPNPVNSGEIVGFNGTESTVGLFKGEAFGPTGPPTTTYATFTWNFGDGTEVTGFAPSSPPCESPYPSPCAASIFHAYQYGGTYKVLLTITDVAGNKDFVEHEVTVAGPPAPAAAATPAPAAGPPAVTPPASLLANGKVAAAPVARAAIISRKLSLALRKGVSVSYSVNEQVAGHFEILLSRSVARRLHVSGPEATGMAPGSAPQVVIAKAILIAAKGGHSTVAIQLSKRTAAELGKARTLTLTLRLIVRNAAVKNPLTTTVVSNATLTG